jgi:hypothetical protein
MVQYYLSDNLHNKNFKISFGFFSLQDNPTLLVPWMVHNIVFLIFNTIFYIFNAALSIASILFSIYGVLLLVVAIVYFCK